MSSVDGPRYLLPSEHSAVWAAGNAHVARLKSAGKAWAKHVEPGHVFDQIISGKVNSFVYGDYLVVFDIGGTWTSPGVKLFEEALTLRLHTSRKPCSYKQVVWCMEALARANGCAGVLLGTAGAYDERLGRVIERLGYERAGGSYYKEV
jgi:hypothetical protein